jgi:hypothetical protein
VIHSRRRSGRFDAGGRFSGNSEPQLITENRILEWLFDEGSGQRAYNNATLKTANDNIYVGELFPEGTIASAAITEGVADENGDLKARRVVMDAGDDNARIGAKIDLPAGSVSVSIRIKSHDASSYIFRMSGNGLGSKSADKSITPSWQTHTYTFAHGGGEDNVFPMCAGSTDLGFDADVAWIKVNSGAAPTAHVAEDWMAVLGRRLEKATVSPAWTSTGINLGGTGLVQTLAHNEKTTIDEFSLYVIGKLTTGAGLTSDDNSSFMASSVYSAAPGAKIQLKWGSAKNADAADIKPSILFNATSVNAALMPLGDGVHHLVSATYDGATLKLYLAKTEMASVACTGSVDIVQILVGSLALIGQPFFIGEISYIGLYSVGHTATEVATQRDALAAIMDGRGAVLGGAANFVAFEGDSITDRTWPRTALVSMQATDAPKGKMFAVGGTGITDAAARQSAVNDSYDEERTNNVLLAPSCSNDMLGMGAAAAFAALKSYCLTMRAAGWTILAQTVTPRSTPGYNTARNSFNTMIRNDPSFYDALWDIGADATIGTDAAGGNVTYYADGTHPTDAAEAIMAPSFATALGAML